MVLISRLCSRPVVLVKYKGTTENQESITYQSRGGYDRERSGQDIAQAHGSVLTQPAHPSSNAEGPAAAVQPTLRSPWGSRPASSAVHSDTIGTLTRPEQCLVAAAISCCETWIWKPNESGDAVRLAINTPPLLMHVIKYIAVKPCYIFASAM